MIWNSEFIDTASHALVVIGFGTALLVNVGKKHWACSVVLGLALLEAVFELRYGLHDWVRVQLVGNSPDSEVKHALQLRLLETGGAIAIFSAMILIPYALRSGTGRRLMVLGGSSAFGMLCVELISYHPIDSIIYQTLGPFRVAAILYGMAGLLIAVGAALVRPGQSGHLSRSTG